MKTIFLFLLFFAWCFISVLAAETPIIIDHRHTDIQRIPDHWVDQVKQRVVLHTGQSHGRQIPYGLQSLEQINPQYDVHIQVAELTQYINALQVLRGLRKNSSWISSVDSTDFWESENGKNYVRQTLDYYRSKGITIDAILHTWSWDFREITEAKVDEYLAAMSRLGAEYPETNFIYMSDTNDNIYDPNNSENHWGYNWLQARNRIRDYTINNNKVFFDFGDIESWSEEKHEQNLVEDWQYQVSIPVMHPDYIGNYDGGEGGSHISEAGTLLKAKAFWWMMARIAGWDHESTAIENWELR